MKIDLVKAQEALAILLGEDSLSFVVQEAIFIDSLNGPVDFDAELRIGLSCVKPEVIKQAARAIQQSEEKTKEKTLPLKDGRLLINPVFVGTDRSKSFPDYEVKEWREQSPHREDRACFEVHKRNEAGQGYLIARFKTRAEAWAAIAKHASDEATRDQQ